MGRPNISCWNIHQNRFYVSAIVVGTVVATRIVGTAVPTKVFGTAIKEMFVPAIRNLFKEKTERSICPGLIFSAQLSARALFFPNSKVEQI